MKIIISVMVSVGVFMGGTLFADSSALGHESYRVLVRGEKEHGEFDSDGRLAAPNVRALRRAGASEDHINQINALIESNRDAQIERRASLAELREQIRGELERDTPDRDRLYALIGQAAEIRTDLTIGGIDIQLEIREILGNDIWQELAGDRGFGRHRDSDSRRKSR